MPPPTKQGKLGGSRAGVGPGVAEVQLGPQRKWRRGRKQRIRQQRGLSPNPQKDSGEEER